VSHKRVDPESSIDPNMPYWVRQEARFAGALGRAARGRTPIAIAAWIIIIVFVLMMLTGWILQLRG
jgi:hypothetical protein